MKSGTTTLHGWLGSHPGVFMSDPKELRFFAEDRHWRQGLEWYSSFFADAPDGVLAGESSPLYTGPDTAEKAARRIQATIPDVRMICVLRHPVDRLRSHYRHDIFRGRRVAPLPEVLAAGGGRYVAGSMYYRCLRPYLDRFPREQLVVVRLDDLVAGGHPGWRVVLDFLGLPFHPAPGDARNQTATKRRFSSMGRVLMWLRLGRPPGERPVAWFLPEAVRGPIRRRMYTTPERYRELLQRADVPIPAPVLRTLWEDLALLETRLNLPGPLWPPPR